MSTSSRGGRQPPALFFLLLLMGGCFGWADGPATTTPRPSWSTYAAILSADAFPHIVVEIDYAGSYVPSDLALGALRESLIQYTEKRTITVLPPTPVDDFLGVHTEAEVNHYHSQTRNFGTSEQPWAGSTFYMHVLYLNGQMEDTGTLGLYIRNGEITILSDLLASMVGPYYWEMPRGFGEDQVERRALIHELGHAFGLVNCYIPMVRPHEDPNSRCHSTNQHSVMSYFNWTTPQEDAARSVGEIVELDWHFDADDEADMAAFRRSAQTFKGDWGSAAPSG